jgi:hypothetical protein
MSSDVTQPPQHPVARLGREALPKRLNSSVDDLLRGDA